MANHRNRFPGRRRFLKQSTALTATMVALPGLARATEPATPIEPAEPVHGAPSTPEKSGANTTGTSSGADAPRQPVRRVVSRRAREPGR